MDIKRKYSLKLIYDFINGGDLEGYDIDELSNNPLFMLEVIKVSGDIKMYELCYDDVKKDREFVYYLINNFKESADYLVKVFDFYKKNTNFYLENPNSIYLDEKVDVLDIIKDFEMLIIMHDITKNNEEVNFLYKGLLNIIYYRERMLCESARESGELTEDEDKWLGMGSSVIREDYGNSKIISDFFSEKMLVEVFSIDFLNEIICKFFPTDEALENAKINTFLINYVHFYDKSLAEYLAANVKLLEQIRKEFKTVQKDIVRHRKNLEVKNFRIMMEKVFDYTDKYRYESETDLDDIVVLIAEQLGLEDMLKVYYPDFYLNYNSYIFKDLNDDESFSEYLDWDKEDTYLLETDFEEVDEFDRDVNSVFEIPFLDRKYYHEIRKIMLEFGNKRKTVNLKNNNSEDDTKSDSGSAGRIIKFNPKGK